nr:hypothetical protein [Tanacetum cinerariifolium]
MPSSRPAVYSPKEVKSFIEEPEHLFSMGYEHFNTTLVTELDEVAESSIKNLIPIPYDNDFTSNDKDVPIEESKVHSNPLLDNDEINFDELESHVESNFIESLSNHDALIDSSQKIDHLDEISGPLIHIHIAEEERIRREHTEYISRMEMLFIINPRPRPTEEIDIVTNTDELLPPGFKNDDSEGELDVVDDLHVDNSNSNSENELSDNKASDFDNSSFPRPPPEPRDAEFDSEEEILVVMNDIVEFESLNPRDEFDVSNDENDDYFPFMFVIRIFLPDLIIPSLLKGQGSPGRNKNPGPWSARTPMWQLFKGLGGKDSAQNIKNRSKPGQYRTQDWKSTAKAESTGIFLNNQAKKAKSVKRIKVAIHLHFPSRWTDEINSA